MLTFLAVATRELVRAGVRQTLVYGRHGETATDLSAQFDPQVRLVEIDGYDVDIEPTEHLAFFRYEDRPGMVGTVGQILGNAQVNIAGMQVARDTKGGHALVALSVDSVIPPAVLEEIRGSIDAVSVRAVDLIDG